MKSTVIILIALTQISCNQKPSLESSWHIVFKNDAEGQTILGDKETLIDAARMGHPIRIGIGRRRKTDTLKSMEHIADAQFLSIVNGTELFGQISEILGQKPYLDADTVRIDLKHQNKWTMLVGTNGEISTLYREFRSEEIIESRQANRGVTWYVKLPSTTLEKKAIPLWD